MSDVVYRCRICGEYVTQDWDESQAHLTREVLKLIEGT